MARSIRSLRRDARREKRRKLKRREIARAQRASAMWNEGELVVFLRPMEQLGASTFYCPDCGILELVPENEDEAPAVTGRPVNTNYLGVRNVDLSN